MFLNLLKSTCYLLKSNQIRKIAKFLISSTSRTYTICQGLDWICGQHFSSVGRKEADTSGILYKAVLKNFKIFTGKHLGWSYSTTGAFLWSIAKTLRAPILTKIYQWVLLEEGASFTKLIMQHNHWLQNNYYQKPCYMWLYFINWAMWMQEIKKFNTFQNTYQNIGFILPSVYITDFQNTLTDSCYILYQILLQLYWRKIIPLEANQCGKEKFQLYQFLNVTFI